MKDAKKEPVKDAEDPTDLGGMLDQFKENITITKDNDGIIIKFKTLAPGMTLESLKSMMESMMGAGGKDLMKRFSSMMGTGDDEDSDDSDSEDDEDGEDEGPGFHVEILADGSGLKLIPDDPAQIDEFLESIKAIFDPENRTPAVAASTMSEAPILAEARRAARATPRKRGAAIEPNAPRAMASLNVPLTSCRAIVVGLAPSVGNPKC